MAATSPRAADARRAEDAPGSLEIVDALPAPVLLTRHADGYIMYANLATVGLLAAHGPQEVVGRSIARFIDQADVERYDDYVRNVRLGGEHGDNRFTVHRLDDTRGIVEIHPMAFQHRGEPALLSVLIDVTDRVRAEHAVAAAEARYRTLIEMAPEGIGVQIGGRYVLVNEELVRLLGGDSAEDLIGREVMDIVAPHDRERVAKLVRETPLGGPGATRWSFDMLRLDGTTFRAEVSSRAVEIDGQAAGQAIIRPLPKE